MCPHQLLSDATDPRRTQAYRILDANLNRCQEGLRVVEEYLRFVLQDAHLAGTCKQLRHDLGELERQLSTLQLHAMRDVAADVGTGIGTAGEYERADVSQVAAANVKRVQQSLRSLEEYAKVVSPALANGFESLRYRAYTLERCLTLLVSSRDRLADARIYVLLDGRDSEDALVRLVSALIRGGAHVLQLRDKSLPDRVLLARARVVRECTRGTGTLFIVNDRVDLAHAAEADGVHLGQEELPVGDARRILGPDALIGVSTHSIEQARQAVLDGASYLGCGPTFPSETKRFEQFPGLALLRQVSAEITLPAFAIGGIHAGNLAAVRAAGLERVAVSHGIIHHPDPEQATRELAAGLAE